MRIFISAILVYKQSDYKCGLLLSHKDGKIIELANYFISSLFLIGLKSAVNSQKQHSP